jgi:type I restriction enzyme S subunit
MERGLVPHNEVSEKQTRPEELIGYKRTSPGEIVINRMRAAIGLIAVAPQAGLVSPDYAVFIPVRGISVTYYQYLFTTELLGAVFRSASTGMGTGSSGFLRLYSESFLALWLPHPPADEQRAIVEFINHETATLNRLHAANERTITLLKERRTALIAAAVTGQIDVKDVA